jgi:CheY-like chemotaxis protein
MPKKILLVDDETDIINIVSFRLKKAGYDVVVAETGTQALEKVRTELPDLILLDINLPEMTGYEVCTSLKSDAGTKKIPVIFISASSENIKKDTEKYGADGFIVKPFEPQELISKIGEYLK